MINNIVCRNNHSHAQRQSSHAPAAAQRCTTPSQQLASHAVGPAAPLLRAHKPLTRPAASGISVHKHRLVRVPPIDELRPLLNRDGMRADVVIQLVDGQVAHLLVLGEQHLDEEAGVVCG